MSLDSVFEKLLADPEITGAVVLIEGKTRGSWSSAGGDIDVDTAFFIASTTKLFTSAIIMRLRQRGLLELDQAITDVLPELGEGANSPLHDGPNDSNRITVRQLLAQRSGLPDYFSSTAAGDSLEDQLRAGRDRSWNFDDVLELASTMPRPYRLGHPRKANYSDTNYQVLGQTIERVLGMSYAEAVNQEIIEPLALTNTWLFSDPDDRRVAPLRDGTTRLDIPLAMTSFGPDGGVVSTVADLMTFVRAFFEGGLFPSSYIDEMTAEFRRINFPLEAGTGLLRFRMPKIFNPMAPRFEIIGHSGLSGAFAYHQPVPGRFIVGTVNNLAKPQRGYQLMAKLLAAAGDDIA